jgi:hypothetical protein
VGGVYNVIVNSRNVNSFGWENLKKGNIMLFLPYIFLQSIYPLIHAHCDTLFMTYVNSYMFRHEGAILRKSLLQKYMTQHVNLFSASPSRND